jgi:phosphoribosylformylglycinamidine cyclo-ligase
LFALDTRRYRQPVLVSSVDGVGTKLKIAFALGRHDTIGQDVVNHCVNDIAVLGAEPLFFLDYLGTGKLDPRVFRDIIRGLVRACAENGCALIGGETAQLPGFYQPGEFDVSGTIVGVVERARLLEGARTVRRGDAVIGLASSGLHTNGYSLARRVLFEEMKLKPTSHVAELGGSIGDELLKVHVSYGPLIQTILKRFNRAPADATAAATTPRATRCPRHWPVRAFAHITGGGFMDNLPRVLPRDCDVVIRRGSWEVLPVFRLIARQGALEQAELYQVFNMGIGLAAIVAPETVEAVLRFIRARGTKAWLIGEIVSGSGRTRVL